MPVGSDQTEGGGNLRAFPAFAFCVALLLCPAVTSLSAQKNSAAHSTEAESQRLVRVFGTITDGLNGGPLRFANVVVGSTGRMGTTDSLGTYEIDSVVPGVYQVEVMHPLLDTLGLTVITDPISFGSRSAMEVSVTTASASRVIEHYCTAQERALGPAVVAGQVTDVDSGDPSANVTLTLRSESPGTPSVVRRVVTDVSGHYRICGLPGRFTGVVAATREKVTTPSLPISIGPSMIALQSVSVGLAELVDTGRTSSEATPGVAPITLPVLLRGKALLRGVITDSAGVPVNQAVVLVAGTRSTAVTGLNGKFSLSGLPSGTQRVSVRRRGFSDVDRLINLSMRTPAEIAVALNVDPIAQKLATVSVVAERDIGLKKLGFTDRRLKGSGFFITADDILRHKPTRLSDVFRMTPGIRVVSAQNGGPASLRRNDATVGCINILVDGQLFKSSSAVDLDALSSPEQIAGIEVYNASSTPSAFLALRPDGVTYCTTVVIWTRYRAETVR